MNSSAGQHPISAQISAQTAGSISGSISDPGSSSDEAPLDLGAASAIDGSHPWSVDDAYAESLALVDALAAHLQRARRLGRRSVAPAPGAEPRATPPSAPPSTVRPPTRAIDTNPESTNPDSTTPDRTTVGQNLGPTLGNPPGKSTPPSAAPAQIATPLPSPATAARPRPAPAFAAAGASAPGAVDPYAELAARVAANRAAAAGCLDLDSLRAAVAACTACELCKTRQQTVFSDGDGSAGVLFVGEAPGQNEDEQGVPFVGAAGELLTDIIEKGMRLERSKVAIANVLKCRPPGNREPTDQEKALCTPWLDRQVELMQPRVVVALGRHAGNHVLGYAGAARRSLGSLRARVYERGGRKVVVTYHPSYLLRDPSNKKDCWSDIQLAMRELGLQLPPRQAKPS
jgi:DNA polymerase